MSETSGHQARITQEPTTTQARWPHMTLRHRLHDWSRRRKFAALLRSYGFRPTREQLDLAIRYDLDQPRKRP